MSALKSIMADHQIRDGARSTLDNLLCQIRAKRASFSEQKYIDFDVIELMKSAGVYRALVARRFGGEEKAPADFLRLIEEIAIADGSAGWVASFGFSSVYLSALPLATLESIYANGADVVFAGGIYPPQPAVRTASGLRVSGRWAWGSGCLGASLIGVGIKTSEGPGTGLPLIAVMPRSAVSIEENWNVNGLQGTGSHDIVVADVIVPDDWTFIRGGKSSLDGPLYRYPTMALAAQVLAVVGLGVARSALTELVQAAGAHKSITGAPALSARANVQIELAKAEAALRSARAFFFEITEEAYQRLQSGDDLDRAMVTLLRLSSTNAARTGAEVCRAVYSVYGSAGVYSAHPVARAFQDALVVPQHAFLSDATWQSAGSALLGLEPPPGFP